MRSTETTPGRYRGTPWGDATPAARADLVRPHVLAGLSASQIVPLVGAPSRNAVCGIIHRHLKDAPRGRTSSPVVKRTRTQAVADDTALKRVRAKAAKVPPARPGDGLKAANIVRRLTAPVLPLPAPIAAAELTPTLPWRDARRGLNCAFIAGDPKAAPIGELMVCGRACMPKSSYCPGHHAITHTSTTTARAMRDAEREAWRAERKDAA